MSAKTHSELERVQQVAATVQAIGEAGSRATFGALADAVARDGFRVLQNSEVVEVYLWGQQGTANIIAVWPPEHEARQVAVPVANLVEKPSIRTSMLFKGYLVAPFEGPPQVRSRGPGPLVGFLRVKVPSATPQDLAYAELFAKLLQLAYACTRSRAPRSALMETRLSE